MSPLELMVLGLAALGLAGALEHVGRSVPAWLLPAGVAVGLLRFGIDVASLGGGSHVTVVAAEIAALLTAAWVVRQQSERRRPLAVRWLLFAGFLLLAMVIGSDAVEDLRHGRHGVPWSIWLGIGVAVAGIEVMAIVDRLQRQPAGSLHDREQALAALSESIDRFRAIAENASDLILETDADGWIEYVNPSFSRVLGYPAPAVEGRNIGELFRRDASSLTSEAKPWDPNAAPRAVALCEARHRDGTPRWLEITAGHYRGRARAPGPRARRRADRPGGACGWPDEAASGLRGRRAHRRPAARSLAGDPAQPRAAEGRRHRAHPAGARPRGAAPARARRSGPGRPGGAQSRPERRRILR